MDKKKILVVSHALELGGAERALLGMLYSFDYSRVEVDLFLMRHQGELMHLIPKEVNLLSESSDCACLAVPLIDIIKKGKLRMAYGRLKGRSKSNKYAKKHNINASNVAIEYSHKYTYRFMPALNDSYDIAISYLTPHYFVSEKANANTKIAWIHTDYARIDIDVESELKMWSAYDYIASISDKCTEGFCSKFPTLRDKILRFDNIISSEFIMKQAEEFNAESEFDNNCIKLLSIGRFCEAKNFDNIPEICKIIRSRGLNVKWYIIGFGGDEQLILSKIKEYNMEDYVIILGKKDNPYPYIKACDLYVQPSRYEGNCVSVHEAQVLNKPVVITKYATSASQLTDGFDGIIVPMNNKECAEGICKILNNADLMNRLIVNTENTDYSNKNEVEKLYEIMNKG